MRKKILFCDNSLRELLNFRQEIIKFYALNNEVVLVAPSEGEVANIEILHVKYIRVKLNRSGKNPLNDWRYLNTLRRIYQQEKPDYIFHYTIKPNIYGTLAARMCHIPSSAMITGLGYVFNTFSISNWLARCLYKVAIRYSEHVLVLNASTKQFLQTKKIVHAEKIVHLPGGEGIDLAYFAPANTEKENEKVAFLMIGRLLYDKGYSEYTEAARYIKSKYSNVEFQLLGPVDTAYPRHVPKEKVYQDHRSGIVHYLGYNPDVIPFVKKASCIVLPSYHEGLSRVLMEAIAMGKPVITSDIAGCRETVDAGKNGFLIQPQNVQSLIDAMIKFICMDNTSRKKMGEYSRKIAEMKFDIQEVIKVYQEITSFLD